jgi:hypothetical protein
VTALNALPESTQLFLVGIVLSTLGLLVRGIRRSLATSRTGIASKQTTKEV